MPSRNRPNTDTQRTSALDAAFNKYANTPANQRAFSADQNATLTAQRTAWKAKTGAAHTALASQSAAVLAAERMGTNLGQVISHFFQVFNLGVARGFFPASDRAYYKLDVSSSAAPVMSSQADRQTWAQNVTDGEAARQTAEGAAYKPMALPSAADVAAAEAACLPALTAASTAKDVYDVAQQAVQDARPDVDALILDLWDTIEYTFRHDDPATMRRKAREWGVVYTPRPGETPDPGPTPPAPTP